MLLENLLHSNIRFVSLNTCDVDDFDFAKALDTASHPKLLLKLAGYGINYHLADCIKAFLSTAVRELKLTTVSQPQCLLKSASRRVVC